MNDSSTDEAKLSRKEAARQQRRAAYLRAKERRATDPRQLALKEAMKQRQREAYRAAKERRKEATRAMQPLKLLRPPTT
jgi:hypothetical protein